MAFSEFLTWLQGDGINAAIGFLLSFIVEWFPAWKLLRPKTKRVIILVLSLIIPVGAALVSAGMGYQPWDFAETFWPALRAGFLAFWAAQMAHIRELNKPVHTM